MFLYYYSWPVIIAASLLYIFISFFVSSLVKNNETASILYNIILMSSMFLSDGYYSLYKAPNIVKLLSKLNIFQYFLNAFRGAYYFDFHSYFIGLAVLFICLIIALLLAVNTFRYAPINNKVIDKILYLFYFKNKLYWYIVKRKYYDK